MKTQKIQLRLLKRVNDPGYYMCWYKAKVNGIWVEFRSDAFVPESVEEQLHELHCKPSPYNTLLDSCISLLSPYCNDIITAIQNYLSLPIEDREKSEIAHFNIQP